MVGVVQGSAQVPRLHIAGAALLPTLPVSSTFRGTQGSCGLSVGRGVTCASSPLRSIASQTTSPSFGAVSPCATEEPPSEAHGGGTDRREGKVAFTDSMGSPSVVEATSEPPIFFVSTLRAVPQWLELTSRLVERGNAGTMMGA